MQDPPTQTARTLAAPDAANPAAPKAAGDDPGTAGGVTAAGGASANTQPLTLHRVESAPVVLRAFASGMVAISSRRHPQKETPNEDAAAVVPVMENSGLLLVADGVGGQRGGDLASGALVDQFLASFSRADLASDSLRAGVLDAIERANTEIIDMGIGAATTAAIIEVAGETVRPYHIGDSMILVVGQRGKVKYQSVSHSPVGFAVEAGMLDEEEAMFHESRHLVSNVVGASDMRIEIGPQVRLAKRDTVLLATDGLFDNLHLDEIIELVRKGPLEAAVENLANAAMTRMERPLANQPSKPDDTTIAAFRLNVPPRRRRKKSAVRVKPVSAADGQPTNQAEQEELTAQVKSDGTVPEPPAPSVLDRLPDMPVPSNRVADDSQNEPDTSDDV